MSGGVVIGFNPANVFAAPEAPAPQADASQVESIAGAAPQEDEGTRSSHLTYVQLHDLVRIHQ